MISVAPAPRMLDSHSSARQKRPGLSLRFPLPAMVRLITHNLLACHAKGCSTNNFPLKLTNVKLALREAEFNPDFLRGFLPRIEWDALIQASREVNQLVILRSISKQTHVVLLFLNEIGDTSLPLERPEMLDDELLKQLHHVLLEVSRHTPSFPSPSRRLS